MRVETNGLTKRFGGLTALDDVSVDFPAGSVTALIGPNGAGKTTLFNIIAGFMRPDSGSVQLVGGSGGRAVAIEGLLPQEVARRGIGVLFQDVRVFGGLSALENVMVAFKAQLGEEPHNPLLRPGKCDAEEQRLLARASECLDYVGLASMGHQWASQLSYGQQKLVALARLLAGESRVLLLDEPTSGVHPDMVDKLLALVQRLADEDGRSVVMIEHNLNVVRRVGDWVYLMAQGRVEVFGEPREVLRDRAIFDMFPTL